MKLMRMSCVLIAWLLTVRFTGAVPWTPVSPQPTVGKPVGPGVTGAPATATAVLTTTTPTLFSIVVNGRYGYIDRTGQMVIAPQFDVAEPFAGGLARVEQGNQYGYIDRTGEFVWGPIDLYVAIPVTPTAWLTYTSEPGQFSIRYPSDHTLYESGKPSVDGVMVSISNTVTLHRTAPPSFMLSIHYQRLERDLSLAEIVQQVCLTEVAGQPFTLDGKAALLFEATSCGPYGASMIALIDGPLAYRVDIESFERYQKIKEFVLPILASFQTIPAGDQTRGVLTDTPTPQPAITPASTQTPTVTEQSTAVSLTPMASCAGGGSFLVHSVWHPRQNKLGCDLLRPAPTSTITIEPFEGGYLIWLKATDQIYALRHGGHWTVHPNRWMSSESALSCEAARIYGYPAMGFGKLWCADGEVRASLGAPLGPEQPREDAEHQWYEQGLLTARVHSSY